MELSLTGNDLTLGLLLSGAKDPSTIFRIQPSGDRLPAPAMPPHRSPPPRSEERLSQQVSQMALVLLANAAARFSGSLNESVIQQLAVALNSGRTPELSADHLMEQSAMEELIACVCPDISAEDKVFLAAFNCISTALAADLCRRGVLLARTADLCVAFNLEAIRGETAAFDARLHELGRPFPGQIGCSANVRKLLCNSEFTTEKARQAFGYDKGPRCQDAICIRAVPQTHGGVRDSLDFLGQTLEQQLNPVRQGKNALLAYAVEHALTALVDLGNISERRGFRLLDSHLSYGLTDNLVYGNPGFNHGMPVVQETATALLGELKLMALPSAASADTADLVSIGVQFRCAAKAQRALPFLEKLLSVEINMTAQAMDLVKQKLPNYSFGDGTAAAHETYRSTVAVTKENRYLIHDLSNTYHMVAQGTLVQAAEASVGPLY